MNLVNKRKIEAIEALRPVIVAQGSNKKLAKPSNNKAQESEKKFNYLFNREEAYIYLTTDAFGANAATQKKAKQFVSQLMNSETMGLIFLNDYLIEHVKDEKRAPAAIAVILKMYNEKIHLASSIESILVENVSSDNAAKFEAGAKLLYHLIRTFPKRDSSSLYLVDIDRGYVLQRMIDNIKTTENDEIKVIGTQYILSIAELLNIPLDLELKE